MKALTYLEQRKKVIKEMIKTDHKIGADPYDNVARLKEVEKVEKIIKQEISEKGGHYGLYPRTESKI